MLRLVAIIMIAVAALASQAQSSMTEASAPEAHRVLYHADAATGWAGWRASGWSVQDGLLTSDGSGAHIRMPYSPGLHGVATYTVVVHVTEDSMDDSPIDMFGVRVAAQHGRGYVFEMAGADQLGWLYILSRTPAARLAAMDMDGADASAAATWTVSVYRSSIVGRWVSDGGGGALVKTANRQHLVGGAVWLMSGQGDHFQVTSVDVLST